MVEELPYTYIYKLIRAKGDYTRLLFALIICVFVEVTLVAQNYETNIVESYFYLSRDTTLVADNTIVPASVQLRYSNIKEKVAYELVNDHINIKKLHQNDTIYLSYRCLPLNLGKGKATLNKEDIDQKSYVIKIENDYSQDEAYDRRFIESNKLEYTGSFSRGVNFGNTQDLVLNSDFNIQMAGDLGNNLYIRAAISDDNIPIQPEGNTQVLQEFDKVFIELEKDRTKLIAGDYELARPDSYFMNYYKKLKGFSASNLTTSKGWAISNKGSFAISRGKFKRLALNTKEGNQGPYKLEGENGDVFLQVLSGTEKVFVDGQLLKRGDNYDYIIDYNRAEIRFTPNLLITDNKRIIVEYEYATQNYLRSMYATSSHFKKNKVGLSLNFYNEQDSKTTTSNIELDSTDIRTLNESGDAVALRNGIFIPENGDFTGLIKYQQINGILYFAPEAEEDLVSARFSNVGEGKGAYIIDNEAAANGRVYKYVGVGAGAFDPVIQLVAPEKKQLLTTGFDYAFSDSTKLYIESGLSIFDNNRFSETNNDDNLGFSLVTQFNDIRQLKKPKIADSIAQPTWVLSTDLNVELKQKNFRALNPYRSPEFARDWNLTNIDTFADQLLHKLTLNLKKELTSIKYMFGGFHDKGIYSGLSQGFSLNHLTNKWSLTGNLQFLNSNSDYRGEKTNFLRPNLLIKRHLTKDWSIGSYYEKEKNIRKNSSTDSLYNTSFDYDQYKIFLNSNEAKPFHINSSVTLRNDYKVVANDLGLVTDAVDYAIGGGWKVKNNSNLRWNLTVRDFKDVDQDENDNSKQTVLGTIEHELKTLNKGLLLNSYYESNSGQEPKIEFQYVKVQKGEGSYVWEDFNQDSLLQINEFRLAPQSDLGEYEKISVFNNEFISSNKTIINQSLKVYPSKFIKNKKHLLAKFQANLRYRIDQRTSDLQGGKLLRPLVTNLKDTSLISFNSSMDNNLFYNRGAVSHDVQLAYRTFNNLVTQITGRDSRGNKELYTRSRIKIISALDAIVETGYGHKIFDSEAFPEQNFDVDYWRLVPQLNYRPSPKFRLLGKYLLTKNYNRILGMEQSIHQDFSLDVTWRKSSTSSLNCGLSLVLIEFNGANNTPVEFELLQGLKDGNNYLWNFNYTRRVGKNFDLIINYNARKSEDSKLVNRMGAQLRAVF